MEVTQRYKNICRIDWEKTWIAILQLFDNAIMRKLIFILFLFIGLGASAQYVSMQYDTAKGETYYSGLSNLEIVFKEGNMVATWGSNSLTLSLEDLKSMQFSLNPASVERVFARDNKIVVYSMEGVSYGVFASLKDAIEKLPEGIYVAKDENGVTSKFVIK